MVSFLPPPQAEWQSCCEPQWSFRAINNGATPWSEIDRYKSLIANSDREDNEMQPLYIRNAESSVDRFVEFDPDDNLSLESAQAADCLDCEAFLSAGIHSFRTIEEADSMLRLAILRGNLELEGLDGLIRGLLSKWHTPVWNAMEWIEQCEKNGYVLDNVREFKNCKDEARAILDFDQNQEMSKALQRLRDKAVLEHRNGETVDCFSEDE